MRVVAIIQARMGSTRLPGKVLKDIAGQSMLARVVHRTQRASRLDEVVVATTTETANDPIIEKCAQLGISAFRGDEQDVLDRYIQAARTHRAQIIVRITSDCPLIDPEVIDKVVGAFLDVRPDYASNSLKRTYPRGLDTEVLSQATLEQAWRQATEPYQRVHVTPYIHQSPDLFSLLSVENEKDCASYRWTVDTAEDLAFAREVYERLGNDDTASWTEVLSLLAQEPALLELNRSIQQKALHDG